ncbi:hypothetical protein GWI33_008709 [Rhynchophorus ferrugineus]|uniref:Uncharacterized protein n=1 Tax=Rhynchophorus ferrugineus TaxID=354439 RepID=A0A834IHS7_RHYFE|nr:hypothetical protein GWI33_008709 [Rhynchophorus ferrugineus]
MTTSMGHRGKYFPRNATIPRLSEILTNGIDRDRRRRGRKTIPNRVVNSRPSSLLLRGVLSSHPQRPTPILAATDDCALFFFFLRSHRCFAFVPFSFDGRVGQLQSTISGRDDLS